jgi:hypothetical protein
MTRYFLKIFNCAIAGGVLLTGSTRATDTNATPDFKEVYQLLRDNLPGATDENLNRAAVDGLLGKFPGKVSFAGGSMEISSTNAALNKSLMLEDDVAYLRVGRVEGNLAGGLAAAYRALAATNKIVGAVLDLRFASGDDFASATTMAKSIKALANPLAVLVNVETRDAAEALAAALRETGAGLIIGAATAGESAAFKELPLQNGGRLRIATTAEPSHGSVKPDITVPVTANDERAFLENPYAAPATLAAGSAMKNATNDFMPFLDHISEADLVRAKIKDGTEDETTVTAHPAERQRPFLRDPALSRAVDLIKGLAALHQAHS